ncbi:MAG TPA: TonB-dependent receptor plug domain-containing protein, partial [Steroidobacteraceae bacterium]|nr:TonB-dependent receptor plug domain-containing protein [Steroidobacteraceae bacterium]
MTAQRREQSIQDVGIAITAYSGEQLREFGFQDSYDIARLTPGVHISGNNGGEKTLFTVRGVTQNDFNDQTESPVAVYVDEGYVAFGQGQTFGLYDLDRVEVLKGPQGTLFGRNATGGLVQFITKKPTQEMSGFADATYGSHDELRFEGAFGGGLTDSISSRTSVLFNRFHPIIKNNYPYGAVTLDGQPSPLGHQDTFNDNTLALRQQLQFEPTSDFSVLLSGNYARTRQSTAPLMELPTIPVFDAEGNHINTIVASPTDDRQAAAPDGTPIHHPLSGIPGVLRPAGGNLWGPSCTQQNFK